MKKVSITKKISITTIGFIAMLMFLAAPMYVGNALAMEPGSKKAKDSEKIGMTSAGKMSGQDAIQASFLMDREVQDLEGNEIGSVADIMIGQDGKVEYIVLSRGNELMGLMDKDLVPVPWNKVNTRDIGEDQEYLTFSLNKQELENAPSFNEEEWQAFLRGEKQQEVRGFYGTEDANPTSAQEQMTKDKTGQTPGVETREPYDMKKKETEKGKEGKY